MMQNKIFKTLLVSFFLANFFFINLSNAKEFKNSNINLDKFSGFWLEMARTPNFLQKKCEYSAFSYKNLTDKEKEFTNFCITFNNKKIKRVYQASLVNKNNTNRIFYIEYAGIMKLFKPFSNGNFYIFYVNKNYTKAIVGSPDKSNFRILSRNILNPDEIKQMLILANSYGLNTKEIILNDFSKEEENLLIEMYNNKK